MCGIIAGIYVALTMINPISWGTVQFRVSNILTAIPFYNKKTAPGILIGIAIANFFSPLGIVDVLFGVLAEAAAYLVFVYSPLSKMHISIKVIGLSVSVALIVGAELTMVYGASYIVNSISLFISTIVISGIGAVVFSIPAIRRAITNGTKN